MTITMSTDVTMEQLLESLKVAHSDGIFSYIKNSETSFSVMLSEGSGAVQYAGGLDGNVITLAPGGLGITPVTSIDWVN